MDIDTNAAVKTLLKLIEKSNGSASTALHCSQAILNLAHAKSIAAALKNKQAPV